MWNYEIERLLHYNYTFIGCYPNDKLPKIEKESNISIIINTGNSESLGEHWVAMRMTRDKCFYFDSFGLVFIQIQNATQLSQFQQYLKLFKWT